MFENVSKFEKLAPLLINYGFFFVLLQTCLKAELYNKEVRLKILELLILIIKSCETQSKTVLIQIFPHSIEKVI